MGKSVTNWIIQKIDRIGTSGGCLHSEPVPAVEDLPGRGVAALLEVGLALDLPPVAGLVRETQDVRGLGDSPVVGDRVAKRGGAAVPGEHADDVVGADGAGVDRADDPRDVLPVAFDPREVDPASGRVLEGAVVVKGVRIAVRWLTWCFVIA